MLKIGKQFNQKKLFLATLFLSSFQQIQSLEISLPNKIKTPMVNLHYENKELEALDSTCKDQWQFAKKLKKKAKKINKQSKNATAQQTWFKDIENTIIKRRQYVLLSGITCLAVGLSPFIFSSPQKMPVKFSPLVPTPWISQPLVKYTFLGIGWLGSVLLARLMIPDSSRKIIEKITQQYKNYVEPLFRETAELEAQLEEHEKAMLELHARIGSTKQRVRTLDASLEDMQRRSSSIEQQVQILQAPSPKLLELEQQVNNHGNILSASLYRPGRIKKPKNIKTSSSMDDIRSQRHEISILRAQREQSSGTPTIPEEIPVHTIQQHAQEEERKHESEKISISRTKIMKLHAYIEGSQKENAALQEKIKELIRHEENQAFDEPSSSQRPISPRTAAYQLIFNSLEKSITTLNAMHQDIVKFEEPELL